jgi:hypothetical protein
MSFLDGSNSFTVGFVLNAVGVLTGMVVNRAPFKRYLDVPVTTIFAWILGYVVAFIVFGIFSETQRRHPVFCCTSAYAFFVAHAYLWGSGLARGVEPSNGQRGTVIYTPSDLPRGNAAPNLGCLTLDGLRVNPADETKHFKMIGTTGTGKSTAIRELLAGALRRGHRAIIADPDGSYADRFYDAQRGDAILNPFDPRSARWDLFKEIRGLYDADQLARSLITDTEGPDRNWREYTRVFLSSLLRQLHRVRHDDPAELYRLLATTPVSDLRELLEDTPAGPYLAQDNGKFFASVRAVVNTHLAAIEYVALQQTGAKLAVRDWIQQGQGGGGVLFLPYRANEIATLRGLISTWMRLAIFEAIGGAEDDQHLWFIVDELDALGPIDGLKDALARLRKFGGCCVMGIQSIPASSPTCSSCASLCFVMAMQMARFMLVLLLLGPLIARRVAGWTQGRQSYYWPSGGCHSSTLLPSGSMTQPNLPNSDSSVLSKTSHPSARSVANSS